MQFHIYSTYASLLKRLMLLALLLSAVSVAQDVESVFPKTTDERPEREKSSGETRTDKGSAEDDADADLDSGMVIPLGISRGSLNPAKRGLNLPLKPKTMVIPINDRDTTKYGMIDDWQASFVDRRLKRAKAEKFDLVILEIDTNGGSVDACERINRSIAECGIPVIAFVKGKAFSGGAIISLGCKAIVMAKGSQIGGAKAVDMFGGDVGESMRQKIDSMMMAMVSNLCDVNKHPKPIALGMVNSDIEVYEIRDPKVRFVTGEELAQMEKVRGSKIPIVRQWKKKDSILTLTAKDAVNSGLAMGLAADVDETYTGLNIAPASVDYAMITPAEKTARFVSNPLWRILLVLIGIVALFWELKSPGHGVGYITFAFCLGLFFWMQIFANNAGLWEVILFGVGATALAVELFILPGFGIAGFIGIGMILISIIFAFLPEHINLSNLFKRDGLSPWEAEALGTALRWAFLALISIATVIAVGLIKGARLPGLSRMALTAEISGGVQTNENVAGTSGGVLAMAPGTTRMTPGTEKSMLIGQQGSTETVLRPSGKVRLEGVTYDAVSEGAFLEAGIKVVVLRVSANGIVVRAV
jgi:membrane-bound serine protease (ClpP class)